VNRSLLLVICDFLLLSLLSLANFEEAGRTPGSTGEPSSESSALSQYTPDMVDLLEQALAAAEEESSNRDEELAALRDSLAEQEDALAEARELVEEREATLEETRQRLEEEAIQEGEEARVRRERTVALSRIDKDVKVAEASVEVERRRAIVAAEQKAVVEQEEEKTNLEARMTAERVRDVTLIEAEMFAKKDEVAKVVASEAQKEVEKNLADAEKVKVVTAAEAAREAALREAERMQTLADAEALASEKKRHAAEQEAEGLAAHDAAEGLAEAKVMEAKAKARLAEATATRENEAAAASGIEARGAAEAKSIEEKARAMKLLHEAGQQHEEFRLRLNKERDVELAEIEVERHVAAAHSQLVGEALKHAKIDIVGGENDFFEKIVRSVGRGKSVDRMLENSAALTEMKQTFFDGSGSPEQFKARLAQWISDFGIKSEDVKNLSVAALIARMMAGTKDDALQKLLKGALNSARAAGLAESPVSEVIEAD